MPIILDINGGRSRKANIIWGLFFLAGAAFIILNLLGIFEHRSITTWTIIWSVILAAVLVHSLIDLSWGGIWFSAALGVLVWRNIIFPPSYEYVYNSAGNLVRRSVAHSNSPSFWVLMAIALLLTIACSFLFKGVSKKKGFSMNLNFDGVGDIVNNAINGALEGDQLSACQTFAATTKHISTQNFQHAKFENQLGSMELFFTDATLHPDGAVLEVVNKAGNMEIYVPRSWNIIDELQNYLGNCETPPSTWIDGAPALTIRGTNRMGNMEVHLI